MCGSVSPVCGFLYCPYLEMPEFSVTALSDSYPTKHFVVAEL